MSRDDLPQGEADMLLGMEKHRVNERTTAFPDLGQAAVIPLQSPDLQEQFILDLGCSKRNRQWVKLQNRARRDLVLVRLCLGGASHTNPDEEEIAAPHMHVYREGWGDRWAVPLPTAHFANVEDVWQTLHDFMRYCNITKPPRIERRARDD